MTPSKLLVLDIETVPDVALLPKDFDPAQFPKCLWHTVVSVAVLLAGIQRQNGRESYTIEEMRVESRSPSEESRLVRFVWNMIAKHQPRIVTYNGRGFDLPVLQQRALVHGATADSFYQAGDKWSNYSARYSAELHCDLLDQLSCYGATRANPSLDELAVALGLPGKISGSGAEVSQMVAEGQLERVAAYNLEDVVQTYVAYLRWALLTGRTTPAQHNDAIRNLVIALETHPRTHLHDFVSLWKSRAGQRMLVPDPQRSQPIVIEPVHPEVSANTTITAQSTSGAAR